MEIGRLLNKDISVQIEDNIISLINIINKVELAQFNLDNKTIWINSGGYLNKIEYNKRNPRNN